MLIIAFVFYDVRIISEVELVVFDADLHLLRLFSDLLIDFEDSFVV